MTDDPAPRTKQQHLDNAGKTKKLYQKPAFRYERVFETLALTCGKISGTSANCNNQRKTS